METVQTEKFYELQYQYYIYGGPGYGSGSERYKTMEEAQVVAAKIEANAKHLRHFHFLNMERPFDENYDTSTYTDQDEEEINELKNELLFDAGYFISANAYETEIIRKPLPK